jgi:hypothetical protein
MRPRINETGEVVGYVFTDPPLAGPTPVALRRGDDGRPEVVVMVPGEAEETYVFTFQGLGLVATPTP